MSSLPIWLFGLTLCAQGLAGLTRRQNAPTAPTADVRNGTLVGRHAATYDQDYFLGIPYAQPPVGDLRFRPPAPLNESWSGTHNATEYSPQCIGYGMDTWSQPQGNYISEDCLTLNVIRSTGSGQGLPVLFWIHGGGFYNGGSSDTRYNQSFIVQQAALAGNPIIAVSINYRLAEWGFLYGQAVQDSGNTVLGFRDQRLALQWVQENIAAFGGDPNRVTIQGESAGGSSIAALLLAYGGRDDGLFAGAIAESGPPARVSPYPTVEDWEPVIANISRETGCNDSSDLLACLREVPTERLSNVFNSSATTGSAYGAVLDGDWFTAPASTQLENGDFIKVPFIIGCNTDEGAGNIEGSAPNTTQDMVDYLEETYSFDAGTIQDLAVLYPDVPQIGIPATYPGRPNSTIGLQFKRVAAAQTDLGQEGPRRYAAQQMTKNGAKVYTYVFNVLVNGQSWTLGSVHFQEVAFVFYNLDGLGYPQNMIPNPLGGVERPRYVELAQLMVRMWISFVNFGDPNVKLGGKFGHILARLSDDELSESFTADECYVEVDAEIWPAYDLAVPQVFAFEQNTTSHAESDWYRAEGMNYVGELISARQGRNCSGLVACGANNTG